MNYSIRNIFMKFKRHYWWLTHVRVYKTLGKSSYIDRPLKIDGPENISIGKNVSVKYNTWLASISQNDAQQPVLIIDDGSIIGNFNHIFATREIRIGKQVLIADKVYISDNLHSYENPDVPIMNQPIKQLSKVHIGDGAWIGENVCIIGASVGRNSVIGSNSVVTKDIPDYCVAVGAPAKVIKRYNSASNLWEKTKLNQ